MDREVALRLVQTIGQALNQAEHDRLRLDALEFALKNSSPQVAVAYDLRLTSLQRDRDTSSNLRQIALNGLVDLLTGS
jgi:hypothetical protein